MTTVDTDGGSSDSIQCQLTDEQIDQLRRRGTEETVFEGDILVEEGEMEADFFVILEGEVKMYQERGGERTVLGTGHPGQVGPMDVLDEFEGAGVYYAARPHTVANISSEIRSHRSARQPLRRWWLRRSSRTTVLLDRYGWALTIGGIDLVAIVTSGLPNREKGPEPVPPTLNAGAGRSVFPIVS